MSVPIWNLFKSYPEWKILEVFKYVEHYWDCCVVGYVMHSLFNGVLEGFAYMLTEVIKFGLVLVLTYMLALFIFYIWERNIASDAMTTSAPPRSSITRTSTSNKSYPFVVEMPSKVSEESVSTSRKSKGKDKEKRTSVPSTSSLQPVPTVTEEEQPIEDTENVSQDQIRTSTGGNDAS